MYLYPLHAGAQSTCVETYADQTSAVVCWGDNRTSAVGTPSPAVVSVPYRVGGTQWSVSGFYGGELANCAYGLAGQFNGVFCWGPSEAEYLSTLSAGFGVPTPTHW
jgi:hypothetical protein